MKKGIAVLVIGVLLLVFSIPFSILMIISSVTNLTQGNTEGGRILTYAPLAGVVLGFVLTTIGATAVFKD